VLQRGPSDGVPVLYLHGMPGSRGEQRVFPDEVLADVGVRIISVDRPGWGDTDPRPGDRPTRARDALDVADALGLERFVAMGLSSGGSYALTLGAVAPDRVERVVLACGQMPYDDEDAVQDLIPEQLALLPVLGKGRSGLVDQLMTAWCESLLADPLGVLEQSVGSFSEEELALLAEPWWRDVLTEEIRAGCRAGIEGAVDDLLAWPTPFEVDLADVRCPVRAIHGTADDWEPIANLRRILSQIPQAQLIEVEGMSHLAPEVHARTTLSLAVDG
jgi:pimeloyl-ACP methyl ester carboxylesterase